MRSSMTLLRGSLGFRVFNNPRILPFRHQLAHQPPQPALRLQSFSPPSQSPPPLQARLAPSLLILTLLVGSGIYYLSTPPSRPSVLNDISFVPYTITAREAISPTSFIITLAPVTPNPHPAYLDAAQRWKWPLWSVEFKQPEVQIARHYTPIPSGDDDDDALRFYIRAVGDGEMSNYLCRRRVGQEVFLRGPHAGFELMERLGGRDRVVFLAGGTGVVPGMQAARAVLEAKPDASVELLWAVRKREEIQAAPPLKRSSWRFWQETQPTELTSHVEAASPIARRLAEMKAAYGQRLKIRVAVDEEGTRFQDKHIQAALASSTGSEATGSSRCRFHDQKMHERASEFATPEGGGCACKPSDGAAPGKNLLLVSGPDGFIAHYAGDKVWLGGHQTQGPIGGVIERLQQQNSHLKQEWIILKL